MTRGLVGLAVLAAATAYALGWTRLARRSAAPLPAGRLALGVGGLATVLVALVSPLDALAHERFSAHMVQHLLLILLAAPALAAAAPLPALLWALPRGARLAAGRLLARPAWPRRLLTALLALPVAWTLHVATVWLWHLPPLYDAALAVDVLHLLEHATFLATGVLFWWPLLSAAPRWRPPAPVAARVAYLVLAAFQGSALGLALTASPEPLYTPYAGSPGALEDQAMGGAVMWGLAALADMAAVLLTTAGALAGPRAHLRRPASRLAAAPASRREPGQAWHQPGRTAPPAVRRRYRSL